jgi:hypothetical protein
MICHTHRFIFVHAPRTGGTSIEHANPQCSAYLDLPVDFIGRFETMEKDFGFVCARVGVADARLPHVQKGNRPPKHYSTFYEPRTRAVVAHLFRRDIRRFGYRFENEEGPPVRRPGDYPREWLYVAHFEAARALRQARQSARAALDAAGRSIRAA